MKDTEDKVMHCEVHVIWRVSHIDDGDRECQGDFVNCMRMPRHIYYLLQHIPTKTQKSKRKSRPIEPGLKLAITLMYKVTGNC